MADRLFVLNGPNLNMLGRREPHTYGRVTLPQIEARCLEVAKELGFDLLFGQSNAKEQLIDWVHRAYEESASVVINPAGLSTRSVALLRRAAHAPQADHRGASDQRLRSRDPLPQRPRARRGPPADSSPGSGRTATRWRCGACASPSPIGLSGRVPGVLWCGSGSSAAARSRETMSARCGAIPGVEVVAVADVDVARARGFATAPRHPALLRRRRRDAGGPVWTPSPSAHRTAPTRPACSRPPDTALMCCARSRSRCASTRPTG